MSCTLRDHLNFYLKSFYPELSVTMCGKYFHSLSVLKRRVVLWLLLVPGSGLVMLIPLPLAAPHISLQASVKGSLSTLHLAVVKREPELLRGGGLGKRSTWRDTQSTSDTLNLFEEARSVVTPIL